MGDALLPAGGEGAAPPVQAGTKQPSTQCRKSPAAGDGRRWGPTTGDSQQQQVPKRAAMRGLCGAQVPDGAGVQVALLVRDVCEVEVEALQALRHLLHLVQRACGGGGGERRRGAGRWDRG